jgi:hypothetical protein
MTGNLSKRAQNATDWTSSATPTVNREISVSATQFYFQVAVVIMAIVGTFANGIVLFILVIGKEVKKKMFYYQYVSRAIVSLSFLTR